MLELIVSLSISSLVILSIFQGVEVVKRIFLYELGRIKFVLEDRQNINSLIDVYKKYITNSVSLFSNNTFEVLSFNSEKVSGRADSCNPMIQNNFLHNTITTNLFKIPTNSRNVPTSLVVRNDTIFITLDSSTSTDPDLLIFQKRNGTLELASQINNGPGFLSQRLIGNMLFVGNSSVTNQLLIYNISNIGNPVLVSNLKLLPPTDEQTVGFQMAYQKSFLTLGLKKTIGAELRLIDVSRAETPKEIAQFEVGSQINDVLLDDNYIFIATPKNEEVEKLLFSTQNLTLTKVAGFDAPRGSGNGKSLDKIGNSIYLGRTVGDKELYVLQDNMQSVYASSSLQIGWSIDDMLVVGDAIFLITPEGGGSLSVIKRANSGVTLIKKVLLAASGRPIAITCDGLFLHVLTDQGYIWNVTA